MIHANEGTVSSETGTGQTRKEDSMSEKPYELAPDQKATQVMIGTQDMLLWGDLLTKAQTRMSAFLSTLAEDFVPIYDVKILQLAPAQQTAPLLRTSAYVKLEEILLFYLMSEEVPAPEETEVRRFESVEVIVGPFQIEGQLIKSPIATLQNLLLVTTDDYMPLYGAIIRHVGKPWLGAFSTSMVQARRDRMTLISHQA
jgi:hypothetical protein